MANLAQLWSMTGTPYGRAQGDLIDPQAALEEALRYDPNAHLIPYTSFDPNNTNTQQLIFDPSKLPAPERAGLVPYIGMGWGGNGPSELIDPSAVFNDPNYGPMTHPSNIRSRNDSTWLDIVGPLVPLAFAGAGAAGLLGGGSASAAAASQELLPYITSELPSELPAFGEASNLSGLFGPGSAINTGVGASDLASGLLGPSSSFSLGGGGPTAFGATSPFGPESGLANSMLTASQGAESSAAGQGLFSRLMSNKPLMNAATQAGKGLLTSATGGAGGGGMGGGAAGATRPGSSVESAQDIFGRMYQPTLPSLPMSSYQVTPTQYGLNTGTMGINQLLLQLLNGRGQ